MKKNAKLVLNVLKPKVKALGFSRDELEGIAADVADNLELDDEASDDDVNAEIEKQVNAVVPYLKIAQKTAQRTISKFKNSTVDDDIEPDDEPDDDPNAGINKNHNKNHKDNDQGKIPAWAQAIVTQQKSILTELAGMKEKGTSDVRRQKLKTLLKDTGTFGKSILKNFDLMKFEDENAFDEFYDGVVEDMAAINQERANEGLSKLGAPTARQEHKKDEVEVISDADVDALAETM